MGSNEAESVGPTGTSILDLHLAITTSFSEQRSRGTAMITRYYSSKSFVSIEASTTHAMRDNSARGFGIKWRSYLSTT